MSDLFKGTCTALITPFADSKPDTVALGNIIDHQIKGGINALAVCGTTGEPSTMTDEEQLELISYAVQKVAGRVPVIAGVGGNCTEHVAQMAQRAQALGVDALLCVTPYYNKCNQDGLVAHYAHVASKTSLPIIAYNVPSRTGVNMLPQTVARLCRLGAIKGLKEAGTDMGQLARTVALCGDDLAVYCGNDDLLLPCLALGARGSISVASNIAPATVSQIADMFFLGNIAQARKLFCRLLPLFGALFADVNPIPVKAAASLLGLCRNEVRLPLTPLAGDAIATLRQKMSEAGIL